MEMRNSLNRKRVVWDGDKKYKITGGSTLFACLSIFEKLEKELEAEDRWDDAIKLQQAREVIEEILEQD